MKQLKLCHPLVFPYRVHTSDNPNSLIPELKRLYGHEAVYCERKIGAVYIVCFRRKLDAVDFMMRY